MQGNVGKPREDVSIFPARVDIYPYLALLSHRVGNNELQVAFIPFKSGCLAGWHFSLLFVGRRSEWRF